VQFAALTLPRGVKSPCLKIEETLLGSDQIRGQNYVRIDVGGPASGEPAVGGYVAVIVRGGW
jgi:hypothetical protein